MTPNDDIHEDAVLAALRDLPACDVNERRAQRLGARCRAVLASRARATPSAARAAPSGWPRVAAITLLAAWCAIYVTEVVRRGAAALGL